MGYTPVYRKLVGKIDDKIIDLGFSPKKSDKHKWEDVGNEKHMKTLRYNIYIYIFIYVYTSIYIHIHIYMYIYIYIYLHIYICTYIYVYIYMYVYMRVLIHCWATKILTYDDWMGTRHQSTGVAPQSIQLSGVILHRILVLCTSLAVFYFPIWYGISMYIIYPNMMYTVLYDYIHTTTKKTKIHSTSIS